MTSNGFQSSFCSPPGERSNAIKRSEPSSREPGATKPINYPRSVQLFNFSNVEICLAGSNTTAQFFPPLGLVATLAFFPQHLYHQRRVGSLSDMSDTCFDWKQWHPYDKTFAIEEQRRGEYEKRTQPGESSRFLRLPACSFNLLIERNERAGTSWTALFPRNEPRGTRFYRAETLRKNARG